MIVERKIEDLIKDKEKQITPPFQQKGFDTLQTEQPFINQFNNPQTHDNRRHMHRPQRDNGRVH